MSTNRFLNAVRSIGYVAVTLAMLLAFIAMIAATVLWVLAAELWDRCLIARFALRLICFSLALVLMLVEIVKLATLPFGFSPNLWGMLALFCTGLLLGWNDPIDPRVDDKGNAS